MHQLFLFGAICLVLMGCNRQNPTPELLDPIYLDLVAQGAAAQKEVETKIKELDEKRRALATIQPQTGQKTLRWSEFWGAERALGLARQHEDYLRLRTQSRQIEARREYLTAFRRGESWPPDRLAIDYLQNKRLREGTRNWDESLKERLSKLRQPSADTNKD